MDSGCIRGLAIGREEMTPRCVSRGFDWILGNVYLLKEWSGIGTGCPGRCGVPIPGGVQKTCRCGTLGHGLADMVVVGGWLNSMILEVFSKPNDSMIL